MIDERFKLSVADWPRYYGNNHESVENPYGIKCGGPVSITDHIGKPLSQRLWEDVVYRLQVNRIQIIRYNESEWCLGWSNAVIIRLDEKGLVTDIDIFP